MYFCAHTHLSVCLICPNLVPSSLAFSDPNKRPSSLARSQLVSVNSERRPESVGPRMARSRKVLASVRLCLSGQQRRWERIDCVGRRVKPRETARFRPQTGALSTLGFCRRLQRRPVGLVFARLHSRALKLRHKHYADASRLYWPMRTLQSDHPLNEALQASPWQSRPAVELARLIVGCSAGKTTGLSN